MRKSLVAALMIVLILAGSCTKPDAPGAHDPDDVIDTRGEQLISTAEELQAFFAGGPNTAMLTADINMGGEMLRLTSERGQVALNGGGYTISSSAACAVRLDDGCVVTLDDITIESEQTALGLLESGEIKGSGLTLKAGINAIHAAGTVTFSEDSDVTMISSDGMGIKAGGTVFSGRAKAEIVASTYAVRSGRGGITLLESADISCSASGDNAVYSDGTLDMRENSTLRVRNSGEHNAALVAGFMAHESSMIEATGGINGMGLFIVALDEEITLHGFSKPVARLESGDGSVNFVN